MANYGTLISWSFDPFQFDYSMDSILIKFY